MHRTQKGAGKKGWWFLPGVILAVAVELILAVFVSLDGYGRSGGQEAFTVAPDQIYDYKQEDGQFTVTGPAPNMELEAGSEAGYVELFFSQPIIGEREIYCYYTKEDGQDFNQYCRIERFLMDGTTQARIFLPKNHQGRIRIDIRGDFALDHIEIGNRIPLSMVRPGDVLKQLNPLRLAAMILIFGCAGVLLAGRTGRRKTGRTDAGQSAACQCAAVNSAAMQPATVQSAAIQPAAVQPATGQPAAIQPAVGRTVYLDAARTIAAFFVIVVHVVEPVSVLQEPGTLRSSIFNGIVILVLTCNLMFFFISGALLLPGKEESIKVFYKKRLWKIVLPFVIYSVFYLKGMSASVMGFFPWLIRAAGDLLAGKVLMAPHFWMIYELLGVYLLAPFFRLMVKQMTPRMEQWLFGLITLSLLIQTGQQYLNQTFVIDPFFASWPGIFLGGYLLSRTWMRRLDGWIGAGGVLAFAVSIWLSLVRPDFKSLVCNLSILMFLMTAALFVLMIRLEPLLGRIAGLLAWFGRQSYSVLLVHWFAMSAILSNGILPPWIYSRSSLQIIFSVGAVTVMSLVIAYITDHSAVLVIQEGFGLKRGHK